MSKQDLKQKTELCEEDQLLAHFESLIKEKLSLEKKLSGVKSDIAKVKEEIRGFYRNRN